MHPLVYHSGQLEVQAEANTRHVADKLAAWVGPAGAYATSADLLLFSFVTGPPAGGPALHFAALSGEPPLVMEAGPGRLQLPARVAEVLPEGERTPESHGTRVGGLVISLERAERARINGSAVRHDGRVELVAEEAFTLCRKYIAPSAALGSKLIVGPDARAPIAVDDPWVAALVTGADTAFLASVSPAGEPDVAHRGGPTGFLGLDTDRAVIGWTEFVGDGVFKSAGNIRATGTATLLVLDLVTGDGLELAGRASYLNMLTRFRPRVEPLVRMTAPFPEQGRIELEIAAAYRLKALAHPRRKLDGYRVTSRDAPDEQAPR